MLRPSDRSTAPPELALRALAGLIPAALLLLVGWLLLPLPWVELGVVWPLLRGTLLSSALALGVAGPLGLALAAWVAWGPRRRLGALVLELLAVVPSVGLGLVGVHLLGPGLAALGLIPSTGEGGVLAGGLLIGIGVTPTVAAITRRCLTRLPAELWEAALALGASRLQARVQLSLRFAAPGVAGALLAALVRAMGEATLVVMACGLALPPGGGLGGPTPTVAGALALGRGGAEQLQALALLLLLLTLPTQALASRLVRQGVLA